MGLGHGLAVEDGTYEGTGEGVASTHGVYQFDFRALQERAFTGAEYAM